MTLLEQFKEKQQKINYFAHAYTLLYWDLSTLAPDGAKERITDALTYFSTEIFKDMTSDEFYDMVTKLSAPEEFEKLDDVMKYHIKKTKFQLDRERRVPADFYEEFVRTKNESAVIWPKAKQTNDWSIYQEPLKNTIEATKKYCKFIEPDKEVYDTLIDVYEEGMTQPVIDKVFSDLRKELVPLVEAIIAKPQPDRSLFAFSVPEHKQIELCTMIIEYMGMDMNRFSMGKSEHPFTMEMNLNDVRFTNHYHENSFISAVFSAIHEGGHAIFGQGVDQKYLDTKGAEINLMGLHESQSRFYENILGRNINFWKPIWPKMCEIVPELKERTLEEFVKEINHVEQSYIRTEADELTYCLHIILRYEIERAIFIENYPIEKLPELWNKKTEEMLHIVPRTDAEGILQDMHWSDGSLGYFPTYLLGSIYDGMFLEAMEKDLGSVDEVLAKGEIKKITEWLNKNIHQYGATRNSAEVLQAVCGRELTAQPLIDHFKKKYTAIYDL